MKGNIFIKRPVMAISISVLIFAIGLISLFTLPVEQYPDIAPPTVYCSRCLWNNILILHHLQYTYQPLIRVPMQMP